MVTVRGAPRFEGEVCVQFLPDGRKVEVEKPFAFFDSLGHAWFVPANRRPYDGASIPRLAWPMVGGPFEGKHRDGALVHDEAYACGGVMINPETFRVRRYTRAEADRAFLDAMAVRGVPLVTRRLIYGAVRAFGWLAWRGGR